MERRPPTPICKCFLVCRRIFYDAPNVDHTLVSPIYQVFPEHYPAVEDLSIFARWSNAHGAYEVGVQLRNLEGDVLWAAQCAEPFRTFDPLAICALSVPHLKVCFPGPGKYEIALLANGEEVAADIFVAQATRKVGEG
jgi:hypothetical protein